ncbi:uncharacterized protein LOC143072442 isoform X2 [Mytilus galloprovincialis]|uniref:uncharacterized protein LOC143072442 isoform X2 n=1 Tax=Mytilus galloprovincialis TaxID=29158 RepID=UPI003F7CCFA5
MYYHYYCLRGESIGPDNISCDFQQNKNDEYQEEDAASCSTQETKANLEKIILRLKEAKEETEQIRRNCQEIIKTYQESEEIKSNSLDQQVKKNRLNFYFRRQKIKTKKSYIQEL